MSEEKKLTGSEQVAWVKRLPNQGGEWAHGIVSTVLEAEAAMDGLVASVSQAKQEMDDEIAATRERFKAKKAELNAKFRAQQKLIKSTVKRADSDAKVLYSEDVIADAKDGDIVVDFDEETQVAPPATNFGTQTYQQ